jgi:hypothetical protein
MGIATFLQLVAQRRKLFDFPVDHKDLLLIRHQLRLKLDSQPVVKLVRFNHEKGSMLVDLSPNYRGIRSHDAVNGRPKGDKRRSDGACEAGRGQNLFVEKVSGGGEERQCKAKLTEAKPVYGPFRPLGRVLTEGFERLGAMHLAIAFDTVLRFPRLTNGFESLAVVYLSIS